jgi:GYF domain 2
MPDPVWYLYQDGTQQGPLSLDALRALADEGKLKPDGLVTRTGMTDWVPARSVPELFPQDSIVRPPLPPGVGPRRDVLAGLKQRLGRTVGAEDVVQSLPHLRGVRAVLEALRRGVSENGLATADRIAKQAGHLAYMAAAVLLVLAFMVLGIRADSFWIFFIGLLILLPVAVVLHFLAALFLDAGFALLKKSPSELSSSAVLAFFALVFLAGGLGCFLVGLYNLINGGPFLDFGYCMGCFAVLLYACGIALHPSTVNVTAGTDMSAGEEALGIGMFLVKLPVRLVPFLFGVAAVVGLCAAVYLLYLVFAEDAIFVTDEAYEIAANVLGVGLMPFLAYVGFALSYLLVELLRAILRTPGRIEALRTDVNGGGR